MVPIIPESRRSPTDQKPEDSGSEVDITLLSAVSPEIGCKRLISSSLRERTDKVLLLVDQNPERNSFNLPPPFSSLCLFNFREKIKQLQSGQTQHIKSTRDIITWQGNECPNRTSHAQIRRPLIDQIIRLIHEKSRTLMHPNQLIHIRSNLGLRQLRAFSAPPSQLRAAPLLAWDEPDESQPA